MHCVAQIHHGLTPSDASARVGRWTLREPLDWREWGEEFVVRVGTTGATCLLSPLAGETLKALRGGAAHLDDIASLVFREAAPPSAVTAALVAAFADRADDAKDLLVVLAELEALGLARAEFT